MAEEQKKKPAAPEKDKKAKPEAPAAGAAAPAAEAKPAKKEKQDKPAVPGATPAEEPKPGEAAVPAVPTAAELLGEDPNAKKIIKAKHAKNIAIGIANILATFNNTQVTITDMQGNRSEEHTSEL